MGHLKAVVFDVDGTLADSERDGHRVAFNQAFADAGLPDRWDVDAYGGLLAVTGGQQRLRTYLASRGYDAEAATRLADDLHRAKTGLFREMVVDGRIPLRPGVRRLVDELCLAGVRLFVATTGSRQWVEPLLHHHFGAATFELTLTGSEVSRLKPDPAVYLEVLGRAVLQPPGVVAVEDSANGLAAAQAAGLSCLVVTNDYTAEDDLQSADLVVDGFGPAAKRIAGGCAPLPGGSVTASTLAALV